MRLVPLAIMLLAASGAARAEDPASLAGLYDGGQMEMAAALELRADGSFRYGLSYGALDEQAEGQWAIEQGTLYLTSEPKVVPPRFALVSDTPAPLGQLSARLTDPDVLGGFQMTLIVTIAGGDEPQYVDVDEDGSVLLEPGTAVTSVVPDLPVYEIPYHPYALSPETGHDLVFRFEPNDLGKADFQREAFAIEDGAFVFSRHGRTIRFRRIQP